jgi:hypothetical protein
MGKSKPFSAGNQPNVIVQRGGTMEKISRRELLTKTGMVAGLTAGAMLGGRLFVPHAQAKTAPEKIPYPLHPLDAEKSRKMAYGKFKKSWCTVGTFHAVIGQLAEKYGTPYDTFPVGMIAYGNGGVYGFGSVCGALNGAAIAIHLLLGEDDKQTKEAKAAVHELFRWYEQEKLPLFTPAKANFKEGGVGQSVAKSILCQDSKVNWSKASGFKIGSKQFLERCGRLTADVAGKTAEIINAIEAGNFKAVYSAKQ